MNSAFKCCVMANEKNKHITYNRYNRFNEKYLYRPSICPWHPVGFSVFFFFIFYIITIISIYHRNTHSLHQLCYNITYRVSFSFILEHILNYKKRLKPFPWKHSYGNLQGSRHIYAADINSINPQDPWILDTAIIQLYVAWMYFSIKRTALLLVLIYYLMN